MELWPHQKKALHQIHNGKVLVGGTGSGKSRVALAYYVECSREFNDSLDLYVITTAKKRDSGDWNREAEKLGIDKLVVDSWNNIKKYKEVKRSLFIFDEQRVVGYGAWTKSFLRITKNNQWILLSATPADKWTDLIPVFIANGFYRNKTMFFREHVELAPYVTYPKIIGYRNEEKLKRLKRKIFVVMKHKKTVDVYISKVKVNYNKELVDFVLKNQWNPFKDKPVDTLAEEVAVVRRIVNTDVSRSFRLMEIQSKVQKLIIFYNLNSELQMLHTWFDPVTTVAEYNGHKHQPIPDNNSWVYLVQYKSGSEAWECYSTNHMAFHSLSYSFREMVQSRGRIDRHNTHFTELYYYELESDSYLDKAVRGALSKKKSFNLSMLKHTPRKSQLV